MSRLYWCWNLNQLPVCHRLNSYAKASKKTTSIHTVKCFKLEDRHKAKNEKVVSRLFQPVA